VPVGIAAGLASQFVMVPVLYLPFRLFDPSVYHRLGNPAKSLTSSAHGIGFGVLTVLVVVGSPVVEEVFFRGLLQGSMLGLTGPVPAVAISAIAFGLAHGEAVQLLALVAFGVVLGILAQRSGRLGPGMVAHATFNAATIAVLAFSR
jgi:CAAX protease family protein